VVEMAFDFDQNHQVVEVDNHQVVEVDNRQVVEVDIHQAVEVDIEDIPRVVEADKVDKHLVVDKVHYTYLDLDSLYSTKEIICLLQKNNNQ
jgi:hypothetical protein